MTNPDRETREQNIIFTEEDLDNLNKMDVKMRNKLSGVLSLVDMAKTGMELERMPEVIQRVIPENIAYFEKKLPQLKEAQEYFSEHKNQALKQLSSGIEDMISIVDKGVDILKGLLEQSGRDDFAESEEYFQQTYDALNKLLNEAKRVIDNAQVNPAWAQFIKTQYKTGQR